MNQLERLLHKYSDGTTSEAEEATLRTELSKADLPVHLKPYAEMFMFYQQEREKEFLGAGFDEQVLKKINYGQNPGRLGLLWKLAGIAAAILLAVSLSYVAIRKEPLPAIADDTYSDPQKAFEETRKALMMLSGKFNEGAKHVEKLETFSEVQEEIIMN